MSDRKTHTWTVTLQSERGDVTEHTVKAFWDPDHALTKDSVAHAARSKAARDAGYDFQPIGEPELVG